MLDICEYTGMLIKASQECLELFVPLATDDRIYLDARYWATSPRNQNDIFLCDINTFFFDHLDEDCLKKAYHYASVPETWLEVKVFADKRENTMLVDWLNDIYQNSFFNEDDLSTSYFLQ